MFHRFRSIPATAMAAVLGCALMATAATPAAAREKQKKEDAAKGPQITPSKALMPVAQKLDEALKKKYPAARQDAIAAEIGRAERGERGCQSGEISVAADDIKKQT